MFDIANHKARLLNEYKQQPLVCRRYNYVYIIALLNMIEATVNAIMYKLLYLRLELADQHSCTVNQECQHTCMCKDCEH